MRLPPTILFYASSLPSIMGIPSKQWVMHFVPHLLRPQMRLMLPLPRNASFNHRLRDCRLGYVWLSIRVLQKNAMEIILANL